MKFTLYPLLALSTILFVGCANLFPSPPAEKEAMEEEVMEEKMEEKMEEEIEEEEVEEEEVMEEEEEEENDDEEAEEKKEDKKKDKKKNDDKQAAKNDGAYLAYEHGVVGNGEKALLFFHAEWCPTCHQKDAILSGLYDTGEYAISTYKVDYDNSDELKKLFGVVSQDTFVLIDGNGNVIANVSGANAVQLQNMLSS